MICSARRSKNRRAGTGLINLFGVYHYDAHSAIVECAHFIGRASASAKLASLPRCLEDPISARLPASCVEVGPMRTAFLSATHGPRSKVNLQLGWANVMNWIC